MTRWTKGDPKPESWPEWLKEANINWCDVSVQRAGDVIWHDGTWYDGTWESGVWHNGSWISGTWKNGVWVSGTWWGGTWHAGVWEEGTWVNGTWKDGTWGSGVWESGTWESGVWRNGVWISGIWKGGHQKMPRFGWRLEPDGLISGYDHKGLFEVLPPGRWGPRLKDMEPEKVDEYYALLHWVQLKERRKKIDGPRASLWDHIEDS